MPFPVKAIQVDGGSEFEAIFEEERRREAVFEDGEVSEGGGEEKEIVVTEIDAAMLHSQEKRQKIADLVAYIENNRDGLYGSRSLRDKVKTKKVLVCSTGAMEKNIDCHRREVQKHGMSLATKGTNNPLKLRTLWHNKSDWETFWTKQSSCGMSFPPTN